MGMFDSVRIAALALSAPALLGACAHSWVDTEGNTHVLGLAHVVLPAREAVGAGVALRVRAVGVSFLTSSARSNFTIGFSDDTLVLVNADACVAVPSYLRDARPALSTSNSTRESSK